MHNQQIPTKIEILSCMNRYAVSGDPQEAIQVLNRLLLDNSSESVKLATMIIVNCQLFGFQSYGVEIKDNDFPDTYRIRMLMESYRSEQFKYLNFGQLSLLNEIQQNRKILISAPTSFGKTSLVSEYIVTNHHNLNNIIFVLPTNALIDELYDKFIGLNQKYGLSYKLTTIPSLLSDGRNIAFLTPERFLMLSPIKKVLGLVDLAIMDETNKIIGDDETLEGIDDRAARFRRVADIIATLSEKCIFLSPYTYSLKQSMWEFVNKHEIAVTNRKIEYINHSVHDARTQTQVNKLFNTSVKFKANGSVAMKMPILLEQLHGQQTIVYVRCTADIRKIINSYQGRYGNDSRMQLLRENNSRLHAFMNHLEATYIADGVERWQVIQALECGIGVHMAPMPRYVKRELVRLFDEKNITVMIATTSFIEGVNTNAENIIVSSQNAGQKKLGNIDILNIIGRAGRFGKSPVGRIFAVSEDVYDKVRIAQESDNYLSNLNYRKSDHQRNDYDLESIDSQYLNTPEKERIQKLKEWQQRLKLSNEDLLTSQNVSKSWKLAVYEYLCRLKDDNLAACGEAIAAVLRNETVEKLVDGIAVIFSHLNNIQVDGRSILKQPIGEIEPFGATGKFIWGALYKMYLQVPTKQLVSYRKSQIMMHIRESCQALNVKALKKDDLDDLQGYKWLKNYLYDDGGIKDEKIYEETFKFISTVVEYKLPLYTNLFIDMYRLLLKHNNILNKELLKDIDTNSAFLLATENNEVQEMIDYGLPQDLIRRLRENNFALNNLNRKDEIDHIKGIDDYEKILLGEFIESRRKE